jgi:hypothetical protein
MACERRATRPRLRHFQRGRDAARGALPGPLPGARAGALPPFRRRSAYRAASRWWRCCPMQTSGAGELAVRLALDAWRRAASARSRWKNYERAYEPCARRETGGASRPPRPLVCGALRQRTRPSRARRAEEPQDASGDGRHGVRQLRIGTHRFNGRPTDAVRPMESPHDRPRGRTPPRWSLGVDPRSPRPFTTLACSVSRTPRVPERPHTQVSRRRESQTPFFCPRH